MGDNLKIAEIRTVGKEGLAWKNRWAF